MSVTVGLVIIIPLVLFAWLVGQAMPTPRDKQLVRLRNRAREHDLHVTMRQVKDPDPDGESRVNSAGVEREIPLSLAAYSMPIRYPTGVDKRHAPAWRACWMRHHADAPYDAGLPAGWRLDRMELPLSDDVLARLGALLEQVPQGTVSIDAGARDTTLCWRERGEAEEVDGIAQLLVDVAAFQSELAEDAMRRELAAQDENI